MMELNIIALSIALAGSIIASYTDIKTKEIPNLLTLSMIFLGLLFFTFSFYGNWIFFIPLLTSYIIIWLIWRAGMWGGGDAKLIMGLISLLSPNYGIEFIPSFFMMLAFSSLVHYFIFGMIQAMREKKGKIFAVAMVLIITLPMLSYFLLENVSRNIAILTSLIMFFIIGDISSSFLPCRKKVKVSNKIVGEILAESIYIKNGKIVRIEEEPSLIIKAIKRRRIGSRGMEALLIPKHTGISKGEISTLKKCCDDVSIFISYPMAPIILVALIFTILFGREMFSIIMGI